MFLALHTAPLKEGAEFTDRNQGLYHMDLVALNAGVGSQILTQTFPPEVGTANTCMRMVKILGNTKARPISSF
jgi:hypothetical protein